MARRPPQMERCPWKVPLSRLKGATPKSEAICCRLSCPSSGDGILDDLQLDLQVLDGFEEALADDGGLDGFAAIVLGNAQLQELSSSGDQGVEFALFFRDLLHDAWLHPLSEQSDDSGIDPIRFHQDVHGFGKVTHLPWIDDSHEMAVL